MDDDPRLFELLNILGNGMLIVHNRNSGYTVIECTYCSNGDYLFNENAETHDDGTLVKALQHLRTYHKERFGEFSFGPSADEEAEAIESIKRVMK